VWASALREAPQKALEQLDALELDDQARERFLSGNAKSVFALGAAA